MHDRILPDRMDRMNRIKWVVPIVMRATHSANDRAMPLRMASSRGDPIHPVFKGARCTARSFGQPTFRLRISSVLDTQNPDSTRFHGSAESCLTPSEAGAPSVLRFRGGDRGGLRSC